MRPGAPPLSPGAVIFELRERGMLDVVREVCAAHHVTIGQVCGRARHASIATARHAVWTLVRRRFGLSYPEIGELFGVDHTTVMAGVKKAQPRVDAAAARSVMRVI